MAAYYLLLVFTLALSLTSEAQAESFCSCATDPGTSVGQYKNAECTSLGVPKAAGDALKCVDFESSGWTAQTGSGSLTDTGACGQPTVSLRGRGGPQEVFGISVYGICSYDEGSYTTGPVCDEVYDPTGNRPCGYCGNSIKLPGDPLQAGTNACASVWGDGEIGTPFEGAVAPSTALAGSNSFAQIVPKGEPDGGWRTNGLHQGGTLTFSTGAFAISKLTAYPDNIAGSDILVAPWKGDQCGSDSHCVESWLGTQSGCSTNSFPFCGPSIFRITDPCTARSNATYIVGSINSTDCVPSTGAFRLISPVNYNRTTDWPYGQVGLTQTVYEGWGTSNMKWTVLFTPLGGERRIIFQASNINTTGATAPSPYSINAFYNGNQSNYCSPPSDCYTDYTTGRAFDNLFIQSWASDPGDVVALLPTPAAMQLSASEPSPADVSIISVTVTPDSGSAPLNGVDVSVAFQDNTGPVDLYVDCAGGTSWVLAVSNYGASPVSVLDFCDYPSQVTAPSQISVRIVDSDADEDTGVDSISVTEAAGKWTTNAISSPVNGTIDSPFLSYDSNRLYFTHTPRCFRQLTGGDPCAPGAPLDGAQGGIDLYYVEWNGSAWSEPINLGSNINTYLNEVSPWLSDDELTLVFFRHTSELVGTRQGMISTRATKNSAWGVPTVLGGDYGDDNQTWDRARSDFVIHGPTGEVFFWEWRDPSVSTYVGHLGRGTSAGSYVWNAPVYYDTAAWDTELVNETQPYISRDGLTLLFNRRPLDGSYATQLWRVTRASTGVNFTTDPTQIAVSGLYAWGEVSADGDEQAFVAQAVDFGQPGYSTHLIRMTGTPASASLGLPTVLNPFVAPSVPYQCCQQ